MALKSIVHKITTGMAILIVGAFAVALSVNYWTALLQAQSGQKEQLHHQLTLLANSLEPPLWNLDENTIRLVGDAYMASADIVSLKVFIQDNAEAIYTKEEASKQNTIYGRRDVSHDTEIIGHIEIGLSDSIYATMLSRLLTYSVIVAFLIITSSFVVMRKLIRQNLNKPLVALEDWTERLANGDYSGPTEEIAVAELNPVVQKFSNMVEKIQLREQSILSSEARFRDLADLLPGIVFETDPEGRITYTNHTAFDILQYSSEDIDSGLLLTKLIADSSAKKAYVDIQAVLSGRQDREGKEYVAVRKDGSTFPMLAFLSPIIKEDRTTGLRGIGLDISNSKKLEKQLSQSHKMEAIGTMAGGIAHDFNNLLAIIDGNTEIINRNIRPKNHSTTTSTILKTQPDER